VLNEMMLKLLVSVVDAQLLKPVCLEDFETEDIEDSYKRGARMLLELLMHIADPLIYFTNNPIK